MLLNQVSRKLSVRNDKKKLGWNIVNIIINITEFSTDLFYRIDIVLTLYHAHPNLQLNPWMMTSNSVTSSLLKTSFWQRCSVKLRVYSYFNKPQEHMFLPWTLIVRYVWSIFSNFVFQFKIKKYNSVSLPVFTILICLDW